MKRIFDISEPDRDIIASLRDKIDNLTKPKGSLGLLEEIAVQIGWIQQSLNPELCKPHNILFAADHGILDEGVSVSPKEVTLQQLLHFGRGGAGINFLCDQHGFELVLVDAGVDSPDPMPRGILNMKLRRGTRNFLHEAAMTPEEFEKGIDCGAQVVDKVYARGCNIVSFGEMGSGNTSSSSMWMHYFTGIGLDRCVGAGLAKSGVQHKLEVLARARDNYRGDSSPESIMAWFGGYELVMAVGGMLRAAELGMIIIVDGFIMTNCILAASQIYPDVLHYAIFGHQGDESGHKAVLDYLGAKPLLHLGLRLGEGSGAVCAYPIIQSAVKMINDMDSFRSVSVTKYF